MQASLVETGISDVGQLVDLPSLCIKNKTVFSRVQKGENSIFWNMLYCKHRFYNSHDPIVRSVTAENESSCSIQRR